VLILLSTEHFENSKLIILKKALFAGKNWPRNLYFLPPLPRVLYLERVQRAQGVVAVEKAVAKAEKVEVLRHIWSQLRLIFLHYLSHLSQV
jgi:hypothetical protein